MLPERMHEKAKYFRIGASIMNFGFQDKDVHKLLLLLEAIEEKGGEFDLRGACKIIADVDEYHRALELKIQSPAK